MILKKNNIFIIYIFNLKGDKDVQSTEMYVWREVSVDGEIYSLRETRSSTKRGELQINETNQLQVGFFLNINLTQM